MRWGWRGEFKEIKAILARFWPPNPRPVGANGRVGTWPGCPKREKSGGKKPNLSPIPLLPAKVRKQIREAGVNACKVESLALCKARVNMGCGGNSAYFAPPGRGQQSGPWLLGTESELIYLFPKRDTGRNQNTQTFNCPERLESAWSGSCLQQRTIPCAPRRAGPRRFRPGQRCCIS